MPRTNSIKFRHIGSIKKTSSKGSIIIKTQKLLITIKLYSKNSGLFPISKLAKKLEGEDLVRFMWSKNEKVGRFSL